jgi:hypothetical protein
LAYKTGYVKARASLANLLIATYILLACFVSGFADALYQPA